MSVPICRQGNLHTAGPECKISINRVQLKDCLQYTHGDCLLFRTGEVLVPRQNVIRKSKHILYLATAEICAHCIIKSRPFFIASLKFLVYKF